MTSPPKKQRRRPEESAKRDWSQLSDDILGLIADLLPPPDYIRFRSLCTRCRSAAASHGRRRDIVVTLQPPRLLLLSRESSSSLGFFDLWRSRFLDLDLPPAFRGRLRCCGAAWGWLVMVDDAGFEISLVNPVSGAQIALPSRLNFPFQPDLRHRGDEPPQSAIRYVKKAVLSSSPTTAAACVVAVAGRSHRLALCRPGDSRWTMFEGDHRSGGYDDIAFIHRDQLGALDYQGRLTVCSLGPTVPRVTNFAVVNSSDHVAGSVSLAAKFRFLVRSASRSGELLMVIACSTTITVFRLEEDGWARVESLGKRALFVGTVSSELVSVDEVVGGSRLESNCIYFANRVVCNRRGQLPYSPVVSFSMELETVKPISITDPCLLLQEPVWVMPTLC